MIYEWLQNIEFANRWMLPFLLLLLVIAVLHFRTRLKSTMRVSTTRSFKIRTARNTFRNLPFWLRLLAIGCIILALARPQTRDQKNRTRGEGIAIILCMDVSGSMAMPDFQPTRLSAAKEVAINFVESRPVDEIGLVIFGEQSLTAFPLTTDHTSLTEQITNLRNGMLGEFGTVIGEGLATAVQRLIESKTKSKVVVLLTDGKEQPPPTRLIDPYSALGLAKSKGIKVYTIGMAADNTLVTENGRKVSTTIDEGLLQRIAGETGGNYYRARNKDALQEIYQQIDRLEKTNVEVTQRTRFQEQYHLLVLAALTFLLLEIILRYIYLRTFP
jgi:Ca-activated chloride channel family protein